MDIKFETLEELYKRRGHLELFKRDKMERC